jgi:hypothetical protein
MTISERSIFQTILDLPAIGRIRRNHGLEHATLHVLSERFPRQSMAGHSDLNGFWLLGDLPTEDVHFAVKEALSRLQKGESFLAVHPNCGTNFVTSGALAGGAAFLALFGAGRRTRDRLERLPMAISLATLALIIAQPLGMLLQQNVTTSGQPGELEVIGITPTHQGSMKAHRVLTRG